MEETADATGAIVNSEGLPKSSKLEEMKARYQQKQLKEREEKLQSLYGDQEKLKTSNVGLFNLPGRGGKVRQLFEERRCHRGPGWNKNNPLEPLKDSKRGQSLDRLNNDQSPDPVAKPNNNHQVRSIQISPGEKYAGYRLSNVGGSQYILSNGAAMDQTKSKPFSKLRLPASRLPDSKKPPPQREPANGQVATLTKTMSRLSAATRTTVVKEQAVAYGTRKDKLDVQPQAPRAPLKPAISPPKKPSTGSQITKSTPLKEKANTETGKTLPLKNTPVQPKVDHKPSDPDQVACQFCGRYFNTERIQLHENICKKTSTKKRKVFDPVKHRLEGTEAEVYLRKPKQLQVKGKTQQVTTQKADWRKKHEEFIANIRAAKLAKAHIAKGGKLSDLPPPPPMDTSDYIQCPHCGRKFCQAAAERHIPKCANIINNKPKPNARGLAQRKR